MGSEPAVTSTVASGAKRAPQGPELKMDYSFQETEAVLHIRKVC